MLDQQTQPEPVKSNSTIKWTALGIGGCLVLVACLAFGLVLTGRLLQPQIGGVFSQIITDVKGSPDVNQVNTAAPAAGPNIQTKFNTLGDPNAPVKIIEYADFQCPYCMRFWKDTEPQIIKTYVATGKVYYEYRSVGAFLGSESAAAAEAAYCAGDQNKFWEYHDTLFSNWTGENVGDFTADKLRQYAAAAGLDQKTFNDCLTRHKYAGQVQQDVTNAKADGIHSTPSFLINGKIVQGAQPFEAFKQVIEAALQGN